MLDLYKRFTQKYKDYRFGYSDNQGMFYNLSVCTKDYKKTVQRDGIEMDQPLQTYADLWITMIKELKA